MCFKKSKILNQVCVPLLFLGSATSFALDTPAVSVSAQDLNQNLKQYIGKLISLNGKIDRILGNGAYIIQDTTLSATGLTPADQKPVHRVLVFTSNKPTYQLDQKQQAGIAPSILKEGDFIKLQGKVEQFNISNEIEISSPVANIDNVNSTSMSMPVLVVQPGMLSAQ